MFLTCDTPAVWGDLDHIQPFDHDHASQPQGTPGQTRAQNLQPLCRKHHLLKTHAGWGVVRDPVSGVTTWVAPTGHVHDRRPTVLDLRVALDQVDPDTSYDLTLRALTGRSLPRPYATTEPGVVPTETGPTDTARTRPTGPPVTRRPPF
ncbi:HNH endonuclease signature motif containing protein [Promicromonospora vindobonensis]|uniref:HNH endonuclease signature motif containing protein n=1 Tax=Promicromonospora vindobonensis TaxID=195748 RepID=A0ABW5VUW3_9MICO